LQARFPDGPLVLAEQLHHPGFAGDNRDEAVQADVGDREKNDAQGDQAHQAVVQDPHDHQHNRGDQRGDAYHQDPYGGHRIRGPLGQLPGLLRRCHHVWSLHDHRFSLARRTRNHAPIIVISIL
jgi:hypothetical protein